MLKVNIHLLGSADESRKLSNPQVSIIVPTYNESQNILGMLRSIRESIPSGVSTETIVVDDNSA